MKNNCIAIYCAYNVVETRYRCDLLLHQSRRLVMRQFIRFTLVTLMLLIGSNAFAGTVSRALFTIGIDNREPVIMVDSISPDSYTSISFFTELNGMSGKTVTHQWIFDGRVMFEKSFEVNGDRWRIWTSKTLIPDWTGTWTVKVLNEDGSVLERKTFEYQ